MSSSLSPLQGRGMSSTRSGHSEPSPAWPGVFSGMRPCSGGLAATAGSYTWSNFHQSCSLLSVSVCPVPGLFRLLTHRTLAALVVEERIYKLRFFLGRGEGVGKGTMRTRFCISPFCCLFLEEILGTMSQTGFHHWCEPLKKIFIVLTAYCSRHYFMFYCLTGSSCHINLSFENNYSMWILCSPIRTVYVQTQSTCRKVTSRFILQRIHFSGCLVRLK